MSTRAEFSPAPFLDRFKRTPRLLGEGAAKLVYEAIDLDNGRSVAWNEIRTAHLLADERLRVAAELELLRSVQHPNIVDFLASWATPEKVVFVTEIVESGNLQRFYRTHRIRLRVVKKWGRQVLSALSYLHSRQPPIVHRDIKCENILYNASDGTVKISDLGLSTSVFVDDSGVGAAATVAAADVAAGAVSAATAAAAAAAAAEEGAVLGTPNYMAPEQYEGQCGPGVDIYAFGMCVLEIVTGEQPYSECSNAAQIYKRVIGGQLPEAFSRIRYASIQDFILFCIVPSPAGRRPTATQVLSHPFLDDAVRTLEDDEDDLARPRPRAMKGARRKAGDGARGAAGVPHGEPLSSTLASPTSTPGSSPVRAANDSDVPGAFAGAGADSSDEGSSVGDRSDEGEAELYSDLLRAKLGSKPGSDDDDGIKSTVEREALNGLAAASIAPLAEKLPASAQDDACDAAILRRNLLTRSGSIASSTSPEGMLDDAFGSLPAIGVPGFSAQDSDTISSFLSPGASDPDDGGDLLRISAQGSGHQELVADGRIDLDVRDGGDINSLDDTGELANGFAPASPSGSLTHALGAIASGIDDRAGVSAEAGVGSSELGVLGIGSRAGLGADFASAFGSDVTSARSSVADMTQWQYNSKSGSASESGSRRESVDARPPLLHRALHAYADGDANLFESSGLGLAIDGDAVAVSGPGQDGSAAHSGSLPLPLGYTLLASDGKADATVAEADGGLVDPTLLSAGAADGRAGTTQLELVMEQDSVASDGQTVVNRASITFDFDRVQSESLPMARELVAHLGSVQSMRVDEKLLTPFLATLLDTQRFPFRVSSTAAIDGTRVVLTEVFLLS